MSRPRGGIDVTVYTSWVGLAVGHHVVSLLRLEKFGIVDLLLKPNFNRHADCVNDVGCHDARGPCIRKL